MIGIGVPLARRLPSEYDRSLADAQCRRFLEVTAETAQKYGIRINYDANGKAIYKNVLGKPHAEVKEKLKRAIE